MKLKTEHSYTIIFIVFAIFLPNIVFAGAWIPENKLTIIGNFAKITENNKYIGLASNVYAEAKYSNKFSFTSSATILESENETYLSNAFIEAKYSIFHGRHWVAAVSIGARHRKELQENITIPVVRLSVGRGFNNGIWLNYETAKSSQNEQSILNTEITMGYRKNSNLFIVKYFTESLADSETRRRGQISIVHFFNENKGVELGYSRKFSDIDEFGEGGILVGMWFRY